VRERARTRDRESSRPSILWVRPHIYYVYIHVRVYTHFCIDVYTATEASWWWNFELINAIVFELTNIHEVGFYQQLRTESYFEFVPQSRVDRTTHTHTHIHSRTYTRTRTHVHTHTHTHTQIHIQTFVFSLSFSLSLSHTHTRTHTPFSMVDTTKSARATDTRCWWILGARFLLTKVGVWL